MQVADNVDKHVQGERISMHADFDHVKERSTGVLKDMRANRAKLPKGRRPPSGAVGNSSSVDLPGLMRNGAGGGSTGSMDEGMSQSQYSGGHASSQSEDELLQVKPKPREWEKNRAPWMAELKASQMKKTSPSSLESGSNLGRSPDAKRDVEEHHQQSSAAMFASMTSSVSNENTTTTAMAASGEKFDMSKSFSSSYGLMTSNQSHHQQQVTTTGVTGTGSNNSNNITNNIKKEESVSSRSQSVDVQNRNSLAGGGDAMRSKSMIMPIIGAQRQQSEEAGSMTSTAVITSSQSSGQQQSSASSRPTSVNLRNQSVSPIGGIRTSNSSLNVNKAKVSAIGSDLNNAPMENNNVTVGGQQQQQSSTIANGKATLHETDAQRITQLEGRVQSLEGTVQNLMRLLKDESDKVKTLKTELEKYAQCVTQV